MRTPSLRLALAAVALIGATIERIATDRKGGRDGESVLFFVGRENYPQRWVENPVYPWGRAQVVREGGDATIVALQRRIDELEHAFDQDQVRA